MAKMTPMMAQYHSIKAEYQDCILMFRLGDFYEMFYQDAEEASQILEITLTARNKKGPSEPVPMCGVPFHAVENYIVKLTKAGKKVAICDQVTPANAKGIVERKVIKVITPGTTFSESLLDNKSNNYIAAILQKEQSWQFAYGDLTTGEYFNSEFKSFFQLIAEIKKLDVKELIYNKSSEDIKAKIAEIKKLIPNIFVGTSQKEQVSSATEMLISYLEETQKTKIDYLQDSAAYKPENHLTLGIDTIKNLEIFFNNFDGRKKGSLIGVLDQTITAMGGRLLRKWLTFPLLNTEEINERLDLVEKFIQNSFALQKVREVLKSIYDLERLISRLSLGSAAGKELLALKASLQSIPDLKDVLKDVLDLSKLKELPRLVELIEQSIAEDCPTLLSHGGVIKYGFDKDLDDLLSISKTGKSYIADLQAREIKRTGISSLKVKFNKVFGYYIEVSKSNLAAVPDDYIRKQTLVNAERFITDELKQYEEKVLSAEDQIKALELELFQKVRAEVLKFTADIQKVAKQIAKIDVISNFAYLAAKNNYCKPVVNSGFEIKVESSRHPVVESLIGKENFIVNSYNLNEKGYAHLITGPNMGGKSTFLRQIALVSLMAQIGSYVPAKSANIGVVDNIFTRIGAHDHLSQGQSTFMVEMLEAAAILKQATSRSLVILDELGRGTSTYDGLSLAWSISEYLHTKIKSKMLFATHYHELIDLFEDLENGKNFSVSVDDSKHGVRFLYKIIEGAIDDSYGLDVAALAGIPSTVIERAKSVLKGLEEKGLQRKHQAIQSSLFKEPESTPRSEKLLEKLENIDINNLTPLMALNKIQELKNLS
jgi:DNA mismatch repair protein MutS